MKWALVAIIVTATSAGELLQTAGMKRHGEIRDFRPGALRRVFASLARNWFVGASIVLMAISFFAFMKLLSVADLSFSVPATAASYVVETVLAKYLLGEQVSSKRWAGAACVVFGVVLLAL